MYKIFSFTLSKDNHQWLLSCVPKGKRSDYINEVLEKRREQELEAQKRLEIKTLSPREMQILGILVEAKKPLPGWRICEKLGIPLYALRNLKKNDEDSWVPALERLLELGLVESPEENYYQLGAFWHQLNELKQLAYA